MARNIIAIGGGEIRTGQTFAIDRRFVAEVDVAVPKLLFIPTASNDSEEYVAAIKLVYGHRLGCTVDVLRLWSEDRWLPSIVPKLESADLIYVGGGNTKAMMEKWRELGVDRELRRLVSKGKPVAGLSAGAICWFRVGNSDWPQYEQIPNMLTARLECLGIVDIVLCPHTRDEAFRLDEFKSMMAAEDGIGVGLDDCCAIQIKGDEYRFLVASDDSMAHLMFHQDGQVVHRVIEPHNDYRHLSELAKVASLDGVIRW
ncbi:MAG: Type 1 glutamine amidotransferase-like domain-containing protein [Fimbriimonas sp.]|nr:Type 1 glutamine amidotransferase-like domain-containing protein [Fimbriimonas sp.]